MKSLTVLLALAVVFAFVLVPMGSATVDDTLKCELYIELNWDWFIGESPYTWIGTVQGDINGDIFISLARLPDFFGKTEHFYEIWVIETDDGETITGYDEGVWRFANYKWVANGEVTGATGDYEYLVGYNMHYSGVTTEFPVPFGTPVSGTGVLILSSE